MSGVIGVVDYGAGNLFSLGNSLDSLGIPYRLVKTAGELADADRVILPGVGAFPDAMALLARQGLVEPLLARRYDFIVATYALHHLTDEQKFSFLRVLREHLNPGGQILIGDVAFETRAELEQCRKAAGDTWDDEEIYFVADELKQEFPTLAFTKISYCAGILSLPL